MRRGRLVVALTLVLTLALSSLVLAADKAEIFSWWTGGGEEEGLFALFEVFQKAYPDIEIINATVAGGAGTNAKAVLKTRMVGGNPPDSFQVHGGAELIDTYVKTGMMEPIGSLLEEWGVKDAFNPQILEMCSYEGQIYSIPVNVHRGNVIFYNKAILDKYGIEPPNTIYSFMAALKKLDAAGVIPLALGDSEKWEATHLFEALMVATMGPIKYNGLWDGTVTFDDPSFREALVIFGEMLNYVNTDHAALAWQDAARLVFDGKAAFNCMGDWAEGYFKTLGWTPGADFGWLTFPGANGTYMVITDTFGLPKNAPHPDGAKAWLRTVASREGQDAFNPIKGSIPARLDADLRLYDPYLRNSMADFATNVLTPSIAHGSAAPEGFITAMNDALNIFVTQRNVDAAIRAIKEAAEDYLY